MSLQDRFSSVSAIIPFAAFEFTMHQIRTAMRFEPSADGEKVDGILYRSCEVIVVRFADDLAGHHPSATRQLLRRGDRQQSPQRFELLQSWWQRVT